MPYTDAVSSISGRNSRASNVSGASRSIRSPPAMGSSNDTLANAGVLSMLKTSTDTGDIGALSFNNSRLPGMTSRGAQRRQHISRLSGGSSHHYRRPSSAQHSYAPSVTSRVSSNTRNWDTVSNGRQGSLTSMQTMPMYNPDRQQSAMNAQAKAAAMGLPPPPTRLNEGRSYSLTNAQLPRLKSEHSLKSQGHEPMHYAGPAPAMPENRLPFVYPTRLKRPGYRSTSPALPDSYANGAPLPPPPVARRPPLQTYHSDYGSADHLPEPAHFPNPNRPPYRGMSVSPVMGQAPPRSQFVYRPAPMGSAANLPMKRPAHGMPPQAPPFSQAYGPHRPMHLTAPHYMPTAPPPGAFPSQRGDGYYTQYPAHHARPPHQNPNPMAHHMFHNAAHLSRHLPPRTDTPLTDSGPPSSDPPSSGGTAPTASNPPTPQNQTTIHFAVDPAFIDPVLTDLPDSTSVPVIPAKYFDYVEGLEGPMDDTDFDVPRPSVPPLGFVQRVRLMLESKAASDAAAKIENDREHERPVMVQHVRVHELAAEHEPSRITIIEEFQAPAELPASPVKIAELETSPARPIKRLTRELVKAELAITMTEGEATLESKFNPQANGTMQLHGGCYENEPHMACDAVSSYEDGPTMTSDIPSSPPLARSRRPSTSESVASSTHAENSKASGMDFALRYSAPSDETTNLGQTETESRDPFALDADTITAQHQGAKDSNARISPAAYGGEPVSPVDPDDHVVRFSAVSPMTPRTAGIDETLSMHGPIPSKARTAVHDTALVPEHDACQSPSTPRAIRSHSKSVHLPGGSVTISEESNTNRLSLPADFSQSGDTTINTTTDALTDMAVRLDLPQTTVTIEKPQIVQIASSSPPPPEKESVTRPLQASISTSTKAASHTSASVDAGVAPLKFDRKVEQHHSRCPVETVTKQPQASSARVVSPFEDKTETGNYSHDSILDLRNPGIKFIRNKYPSTHLPDLKEESVDDMSIGDARKSNDIAAGMHFQLPARIAAVKAMQERKQQELEDKAKMAESGQRHYLQAGRPLGETRDLPSLNFSRMDLIDKLNEALQIRPTSSLEIIRRREFSPIYCPSPQHPRSVDLLHDPYLSFFVRPEDSSSDDDASDDAGDHEAADGADESEEGAGQQTVDGSSHRPLSPDEHLLQVATQVNRLSIPSVSGLSERLSELLPSLRNLHLDSILGTDRDVARTIEDIHHLGHGGERRRPDTLLSTRTSAGFRTLAERAEEIVLNGTHDSIVPPFKTSDLNSLPASALYSKDGKVSQLSSSASAPSALGKEPTRPELALVRLRSPTSEEEVRQMLPPEMNPIARSSKRSLVLSSRSSRPWNLDENYPWASNNSNLAVDLKVPSQVHHRTSATSIVSRERGTRSLDLTPAVNRTVQLNSSGIDIGSINTELDPSTSTTTEQLIGFSRIHGRKPSKLSILGSIKFRLTKAHQDESSGKALCNRPLSVSDEQHHGAGDRYPTTALTPPSGFNIDEVCSHFSDDSSDKERKMSKGRRWTALKGKPRSDSVPVRTATFDATLLDDSRPYDAGALIHEHLRAESAAAYTLDGIGMGKAEFRIKRFGEKLRLLIARSGQMLRSLSTKSRARRIQRDEWLEDSLYSGA